MSGKSFNFWQDHSVHYLEMAFRTDRQEEIEHPDGYGEKTGECGDTVKYFITLRQGRIQWINFIVHGCRNTNACANTVAHLAEGKTVGEAWEVTVEDIIGFLETLPAENHHCAELSVGAFYLALASCREREREPWKKLYF